MKRRRKGGKGWEERKRWDMEKGKDGTCKKEKIGHGKGKRKDM